MDSQIFILTVNAEYMLMVEDKPWRKGNIYFLYHNIDISDFKKDKCKRFMLK